jgi:hypothetical protein
MEPNTRINQYLNEKHPYTKQTNELIFFNPKYETTQFLIKWLKYRNYGVLPPLNSTNRVYIEQMTTSDLSLGNYPHIMNFVSFDPAIASIEFLMTWLSHYGTATATPQPRQWYIANINIIMKSHKRTSYSIKDSHQFLQRYYGLHELSTAFLNETDQILNILSTKQFKDWKTSTVINNAVIEQHIKQKSKPLLSYLLSAGVLLAPIVYNQATNKYTLTGTRTTTSTKVKQLLNNIQTQGLAVFAPAIAKSTANHIIKNILSDAVDTELSDSVIDDIFTSISKGTSYIPKRSSEYVVNTIKKQFKSNVIYTALIDTVVRSIHTTYLS